MDNLLTTERHHLILQKLYEQKNVKVLELVEELETSESTIRRDLATLEKEQKLKRVHGGATIIQKIKDEPSMAEKAVKNLQQKLSIAKYAANMIENQDCVFLDAGSTVFQMVPYMKANNITVVTNGLNHLPSLLEMGIETYLLGGFVKPKTEAIVGQIAIDNLRKYQFDKVFLGVNGIHKDFGYTTPDPEEAAIKALAMKQGREAFILADYSKMHETTFSKIASLEEAAIITDYQASEYIKELKDKTRIEVMTP